MVMDGPFNYHLVVVVLLHLQVFPVKEVASATVVKRHSVLFLVWVDGHGCDLPYVTFKRVFPVHRSGRLKGVRANLVRRGMLID